MAGKGKNKAEIQEEKAQKEARAIEDGEKKAAAEKSKKSSSAAKNVKLVKMKRSAPYAKKQDAAKKGPGVITTADVHPDEVNHMEEQGWQKA